MSEYEENFNKAGFYKTRSSYSQTIPVCYSNITWTIINAEDTEDASFLVLLPGD